MSEQDAYVLGTGDDELERLGLQHQLWRAQAYALFERARLRPGQRILDVGSGPGFTTRDLSALTGPSGAVLAVDQSSRFLTHLGSLGLANVTTLESDVQTLALPPASFDAAYARWVMCFVPDPSAVIAGVARALKPGGVFAVQDYFHYLTIGFAPRAQALTRFFQAVDTSWRRHGGDPDIARRLPALFAQHGMKVVSATPIVRSARPNDSLWQWPVSFLRTNPPVLVREGLLSSSEAEAAQRELLELGDDPEAVFVTPLLVDYVAMKA